MSRRFRIKQAITLYLSSRGSYPQVNTVPHKVVDPAADELDAKMDEDPILFALFEECKDNFRERPLKLDEVIYEVIMRYAKGKPRRRIIECWAD